MILSEKVRFSTVKIGIEYGEKANSVQRFCRREGTMIILVPLIRILPDGHYSCRYGGCLHGCEVSNEVYPRSPAITLTGLEP